MYQSCIYSHVKLHKLYDRTRATLIIGLSTILLQGCTPLDFSEEPCYNCPPPQLSSTKIALVLGGGGAKGMAHVGVMEELLAAGIEPDLIVGCSAGAIVGALYADQPDISRLKRLFMKKKRKHLLNISLSFLPFGLSDGNALHEFLVENLKAKHFHDLKIPFIAVATNLQYGDHVPFGTGLLEPALRASSAYPGVFLPVSIQGQYFVDGGVTDNLPAEVARRMGAKYVIAVELDTELSSEAPESVVGVIKRSLEISLHYQGTHSRKYANYVIKVPLTDVGTFDDKKNEFVYEKGKAAARLAIPKILEQIKKLK